MGDVIRILIKCAVAMVLGIFEGNGAVYFFNKMPGKWFCDYGQEPTAEMMDPYTQRIKSTPWKYLFSMLFIVLNIVMVMDSIQFMVAATLTLWLLLEMSIGDIKYRIIPDQLLLLLAVCGLGFIIYNGSWQTCLLGTAIGFGIMFLIALIGKFTYKRDTLGGGDIKLFTCLGFILGPSGVLMVFMLTSFISAGHYVFLMARKRIGMKDTMPMVPYIALSTMIYLVFLYGKLDFISL